MRLCRVPVRGVTLAAAGAVIEAVFCDYKKEIICAAAGPLAGALLGILLLRLVPDVALISFLLSAANLLPLYPLDGGRILRAAMYSCFSDRADRIVHIITVTVCCILMVAACWGAVCLQMGLWPIFLALALLCRAGTRE